MTTDRPALTPADLASGRFAANAARAAIFDFDGTLAESGDVWHEVDVIFFERRGIAFDDDFADKLSVLGFEEGARYAIGAYDLPDTVEEICDEWNRLGRKLYERRVCLRPGAEAYIRALRAAGVPVALATTNDPDVIAAMEPRVPVSELLPVRVHGRDVEHHTKNHPDIYLEAARRLGVEPSECLVFEDILPAVLTAKRAGMRAVGVRTSSPHQQWELIRHAADLVIDGWEGLA